MRFENEETELTKFIQFLQEAYPTQFNTSEDVSLEEVLQDLQKAHIVWGAKNSTHGKCACARCLPSDDTAPRNFQTVLKAGAESLQSVTRSTVPASNDRLRTNALENTMQDDNSRTSNVSRTETVEQNNINSQANDTDPPLVAPTMVTDCCDYLAQDDREKIFVIEIHNKGEDFYLVGHMYPDNGTTSYGMDVNSEYHKLHLVSKSLHYGSIGILFLMVCEVR